MVCHLVIWSLKIVQFQTASGKIPITLAGLGLEQRFFLNESFNNKLYEYEAIFEQLFSEKKLFKLSFKINRCSSTNPAEVIGIFPETVRNCTISCFVY